MEISFLVCQDVCCAKCVCSLTQVPECEQSILQTRKSLECGSLLGEVKLGVTENTESKSGADHKDFHVE